ncbi:MAG TPA: redoxin family protein [Candidatus Saccharimonadales bacterium]|jgi:peroxiredoxin|nr:redoxin family protein [Candidatus Saccharimonadales bacterium]
MNQPMAKFAIISLTLAVCFSMALAAQQSPPAKDPEFEEQFQQGQKALEAHRYKDAVIALKKANKLRQDSCAACYIALGVAYARMGQIDDALKSCDKAGACANDDPTRAAAHNLKGTVLLSIAGTDSKKLLSAESEYRVAVQADKSAAIHHMGLAKTLLRRSMDAEAKEELQVCLRLNPDTRTAEEARLMLADPRRGREEFAPDFEIQTVQGESISLQQLKGKVVVMDFWATWCPPCRASVPELRDLTRKYPTSKLVLISVSADDDEQAWRDFIAKKNMDWVQYLDSNHKVLNAFGIHAFPTYLVIDGDGIVKQRITGLDPRESVVHRLKATLGNMPQLEGERK